MVKDTAILRYRPNYWLIAEVDYQLGKYLRQLFHLYKWKCVKLGKPSWEAHITVISGSEKENISRKDLWWLHEGKTVSFSIEKPSLTNGNAIWYSVSSPQLEEIREELGLSRNPKVPLHLCIGYLEMGKEFDLQIPKVCI